MNSGDMVSKAISVEMTRQGLTAPQLARKAGLSYGALHNHLKTGKWTLRDLDRVADPLGFKSAIDIAYAAKSEQELSKSRLAA